MNESNKKRIPEFIVRIFLVIISAAITFGIISFTSHKEQVAEKAKISNFINGCIQNDIAITQSFAKLLRSYLEDPVSINLTASTFSWQNESAIIQSISNQIGVLDVSIVKEFSNYVGLINQSKGFRESLYLALKKNNNDTSKVKLELKVYIHALESQVTVGKKIVNLINGKKEQLNKT